MAIRLSSTAKSRAIPCIDHTSFAYFLCDRVARPPLVSGPPIDVETLPNPVSQCRDKVQGRCAYLRGEVG